MGCSRDYNPLDVVHEPEVQDTRVLVCGNRDPAPDTPPRVLALAEDTGTSVSDSLGV